MKVKDPDVTSYGAEALPGGLSEIHDARSGRPPTTGGDAPVAQPAPVVGLIALMAHWLGQSGKRR